MCYERKEGWNRCYRCKYKLPPAITLAAWFLSLVWVGVLTTCKNPPQFLPYKEAELQVYSIVVTEALPFLRHISPPFHLHVYFSSWLSIILLNTNPSAFRVPISEEGLGQGYITILSQVAVWMRLAESQGPHMKQRIAVHLQPAFERIFQHQILNLWLLSLLFLALKLMRPLILLQVV